jgi:predicted  nucleic acid-binding Zn-ribbon protein
MIFSQEITKALQDSAKQLIIDFGLSDIETRLMGLPDRIKEKQDQITANQAAIEALKRSAEEYKAAAGDIKAVTEAEVTVEPNGDGKPRFSNDKLRSAETTRRLAASEEYQAAREEAQGYEEQISTEYLDIGLAKNEVSKLESTMANYRAILSSRAAQLTAIFGGTV